MKRFHVHLHVNDLNRRIELFLSLPLQRELRNIGQEQIALLH